MKFAKYFLILLLYFNVINPSISLLQMKDLYSVLKVEKNFFSPIYGLILSETSYLKNLYEFGDETSPMVKLVRELFFIHHDQVTFDRTYSPFKPAAFFTPEIIGQLIGCIENYKQKPSEENKNAIAKLINSLVFDDIEQKKIKSSINNKILEFIQRIIDRIKKEEIQLDSKISSLEEEFKTDLQGTRQEKHQRREKINKEINLLKQKVQTARKKLETQESIKSNSEKIKEYLLDNTNQLIKNIFSSIEQENNTIFENYTIFTLLAFLWKIASTKEDFVKYFESLSDTLQEKSIFKNPEFLSKEKEAFLRSAYTKENYLSLIGKVDQLNFDNFEDLVFIALGFTLYDSCFPKYIEMKGSVSYNKKFFSDCGETVLLNFFNVLLFDPDSGNFNIDILKKLGAKQSIIDFYEKYKSNSRLSDTLELHNDWAKVVSGLPNVAYNSGTSEIRAGLENDRGLNNFLNVIKDLLLPNDDIPAEQVLEKLKAKLEKIEFVIKIDKVIIKKSENSILVLIDFLNQSNRSFKLKLEILRIHFVLSFLEEHLFKYKLMRVVRCSFNQIYSFPTQFMMLASLLVLQFDSFDNNKILWLNIVSHYRSIFYYYELFLFFSSVLTDNFKIDLIANILSNKYLGNFNYKYKKDLITKLYLSLSDDLFIQMCFWNKIFSYGVSKNNLKDLYTLKKLSKTQRLGLIRSILSKDKKDFFDIVKDILNRVSENEKTQIIRSIIQYSSYKNIMDYFMPLVNNIYIKNKRNIAEVISYILLNNKKEFFVYVIENIDKINNRKEKNDIILHILEGYSDVMYVFYPFVKDNLLKIQDKDFLELCLEEILKSNEKIEEFKTLIKKLIKKIEKEDSKSRIISLIIQVDQKAMKDEGLYNWAIENISSIVSQSNKVNIMYSILFANPKVMKEEGFYDWVVKNRNSFSDEYKKAIDNWIGKYSGDL